MNLFPLEYGIVSIPMSSIDSTLWFNRTSGQENHIEIQDLVELRQALVERCIATQFASAHYLGGSVPLSAQVFDLNIIGTDSSTQFYLRSVATNYSEISCKLAGTNISFDYNGQTYKNDPPYFPGHNKEYDYTKRFILGLYDQLIVTNFTGPYIGLNNTYNLVSYDGSTFYYGNTEASITYTKDLTQFEDNTTGAHFEKQFVPWISTSAIDIYSYNVQIPTVTKGNILSGIIFDCPIWEEVVYNGWPLFNRLDTWDRELGLIDAYLFTTDPNWGFGGMHIIDTPPPTKYAFFRAMLYLPLYYPNGDNIPDDFYKMGFYIEPSKFNIETFNNYLEIQIDLPSLWSSIGSTAITAISGFNYVTFSDNNITSRYGYDRTPIQGKHSLTKKMLQERYDVMKQMNTTKLGGNLINGGKTVTWKTDLSGNRSTKSVYASSWVDALTKFDVETWTQTTINAPPDDYIYSFTDGYWFYIGAQVTSSYLNNPKMTDLIDSKLAFYAAATPIESIGIMNTAIYYRFENWGLSWLYNDYSWNKFDEDTTFTARISCKSAVINSPITMIGSDINYPTEQYKLYIKGFGITDETIMAQWNFSYCVT